MFGIYSKHQLQIYYFLSDKRQVWDSAVGGTTQPELSLDNTIQQVSIFKDSFLLAVNLEDAIHPSCLIVFSLFGINVVADGAPCLKDWTGKATEDFSNCDLANSIPKTPVNRSRMSFVGQKTPR